MIPVPIPFQFFFLKKNGFDSGSKCEDYTWFWWMMMI
jgi:hypothetical protein